MKPYLPFILGIILTGISFATEKAPKEDLKSEVYLKKRDEERKENKKLMDIVFKNLPSYSAINNKLDEFTLLLLTVDSTEKADAVAKIMMEKNKNPKEMSDSLTKEVYSYFKKEQQNLKNPEYKAFTSHSESKREVIFKVVKSFEDQGLITPKLANALMLFKPEPIPASPVLSPDLKSYWKKFTSVANTMNRILFSLKEKNDIPRVTTELKELQKDQIELKKLHDKIYPLKSDEDKKGNLEMNKRIAGALEVHNVMLDLLDRRGFIKTNDPDMKDISKTIGEVVR